MYAYPEVRLIYLYESPYSVTSVAFYDRASTKPQQNNYARSWHCGFAREVCKGLGFKLIESGDTRNGGVCFLDVISGVTYDQRHELLRAFSMLEVDAVIAVSYDRLCRNVEASRGLSEIAKTYGKSLGYLLEATDEALLNRAISMIKGTPSP